MKAEALLRELDGMRAIARALVHGDADADDLVQDAAVATLEHPPETDRPLRPWLAAVLRNRRRMDRRGDARRRAREEALAVLEPTTAPAADAMLDRARMLERLAAALVALEEPFRTTVIRRYLDGQSAAAIARALGVPPGTVRWRLKTGLDRLRAVLDDREPRWRHMILPLATGAAVKTKTSIVALVILVLLVVGGVLVLVLRPGVDAPTSPAAPTARSATPGVKPPPAASATPGASDGAAKDPLPGQGRARVAIRPLAGGAAAGRVINWSTGAGVAGADLTFTGDAGAVTVRSRADGGFELAPPAPGRFSLTAVSAAGFLPYAPELLHSTVHFELARDRAVGGITVFLFPAVDYNGRVVDERDAPVAGARVRLLGTPTGEQAIEKLDTEWTTDKDGRFTFHAADDAVFEAVKGKAHGYARLDGDVAITHELVIKIDRDVPAHDATLRGKVVDKDGAPMAEVLVRAMPAGEHARFPRPRATAFAVTGPDGRFTLTDLDRWRYEVAAHAEGYAPAMRDDVYTSDAREIVLVLDGGQAITGRVVDADRAPVPAYTLLVLRRDGTVRELVIARSIVNAAGKFEVRVPAGDYELVAAATGWAPSAPTSVTAGARDVELAVSAGATLKGTVVAADGKGPIALARVMREARGGGASAQPANAGTVTRDDGTFELTGIPPGPVSITIGAGGFHPKIEAGLTAIDGGTLGPLTIALKRLAPGETPSLELVGIGVQLSAGPGDYLRVDRVIAGGGAEAAGIVFGDQVVAVEGAPVADLGVEGAVARIRGVEGTKVTIVLRREGKLVTLAVERRKVRA